MSDESRRAQKPDPLPAAEDRSYINKYTLQTLNAKRPPSRRTLGRRIAMALEGLNRKLWYQIFRLTFHTAPVTKRIPIDQLESLFVLPYGDAIGDMLVALPIFRAIKRRNPQCVIGTVVSERSQGLLRSDKDVDERYRFRGKSDLRNIRELLRARKRGYQVVLQINLNHRTEFGIYANLIGPRGVKVCTSHKRQEMYRLLFDHLVPFDRDSMHMAQLGLMMLEAVVDMGEPIKQWESRPTIAIDQQTEGSVGKRIASTLDALGARWYIHFNTEARNAYREWGLDNCFEFAKRFEDRYPDGAILFSSSPVRRAEIETRLKASTLKRSAVFPTSYDLLEVAVLAERSRMVLTPDTSITHFATAAGKPLLVLWLDPNDLPMPWIGLQIPSINLAPASSELQTNSISVEDALVAVDKLLGHSWDQTATSMGLTPATDILYQAANTDVCLKDVVASSTVPSVFVPGAAKAVPLSSLSDDVAGRVLTTVG